MKSTPGPWHAYQSGDPNDPAGKFEIGVMTQDESVICDGFGRTTDGAANAHLVASAPDLLEALEQSYLRMATVLDNFPVEAAHLAHHLEEAVNDIEQVLFKAKRAEGL